MKLLYQGNTPLDDWHKRRQRREMIIESAKEFLGAALVLALIVAFVLVGFAL